MARELDSDVLRRLQESYGGMSDGQLLGLAVKPEDLTDLALEVLRGELSRRRLEPVTGQPAGWDSESAVEIVGVKPMPAGSVPLMTFNDAIACSHACDYLEDDGLEIDVRDLSVAATGGSMYGGPPVALQIIVPRGDLDRAQRLLREKTGLFPLYEVQGDDAPEDGALLTLGSFGHREDADEVAQILEEARVWHRVSANPEGSAETEDAYDVEVREADQPRALEIVENAMGISEG